MKIPFNILFHVGWYLYICWLTDIPLWMPNTTPAFLVRPLPYFSIGGVGCSKSPTDFDSMYSVNYLTKIAFRILFLMNWFRNYIIKNILINKSWFSILSLWFKISLNDHICLKATEVGKATLLISKYIFSCENDSFRK